MFKIRRKSNSGLTLPDDGSVSGATVKSYKSTSSRAGKANSSPGIAYDDRMARVKEGVDLFHSYLTSASSICLPASFRWAIAEETRACLMKCPGCASLNEGTLCARNGQAHSLMKSVQHTFSPNLPYCVTDRGSWEKVRTMVHFTVNHQARADAKWYQAMIQSLGRTNIIPKKLFPEGEEKRNVMVATLFCEILATILLSHSIHTLYIALGKPVPPLPVFQETWDSIKPTYQDVLTQGILKPGKSIRWPDKKSTSHVPIITNKDIDTSSKIWNEHYPPSTRDYLLANMVNMHPLCVLSLAPHCMTLTASIIGGKFSLPETLGATPWKKLDKMQYCTQGGFTRADWELMQAATSECYDTVF